VTFKPNDVADITNQSRSSKIILFDPAPMT